MTLIFSEGQKLRHQRSKVMITVTSNTIYKQAFLCCGGIWYLGGNGQFFSIALRVAHFRVYGTKSPRFPSRMEDRESKGPGVPLLQTSASLPSPRNPPEKRTSEGTTASAQKAPDALLPPSLRLQNSRTSSQASGDLSAARLRTYSAYVSVDIHRCFMVSSKLKNENRVPAATPTSYYATGLYIVSEPLSFLLSSLNIYKLVFWNFVSP